MTADKGWFPETNRSWDQVVPMTKRNPQPPKPLPQGKRPGRRTAALTVEQRLEKVSAMYLAGISQHAIGEKLGVSQQQVSKDLAAAREQWRAAAVRNIDEIVSEQLAKVDALERKAQDGWRSSRRNSVKETVEDSSAGTTTKKTVAGQAGDPRFLAQIAACIKLRLEILQPAKPKDGQAGDGEGYDSRRVILPGQQGACPRPTELAAAMMAQLERLTAGMSAEDLAEVEANRQRYLTDPNF